MKCVTCYQYVKPDNFFNRIILISVFLFIVQLLLFGALASALPVDITPFSSNPANGSTVNNRYVNLEWNITSVNPLDTIIFNYNNTNYSLYDNSLVLYYNLDNRSTLLENHTFVKDISSYLNNARTLKNLTITTKGRYNNAIYFNDSSGIINVTNKFITNYSDLTMCAWFNMSGRGGADFGRIFDNSKVIISTGNAINSIQVLFDGSTDLQTGANIYTLGTWNQLCVQRNGTGYTTIYINGVNITSGNAGAPNLTTQTNLYIGGRPDFLRNFNGSIDEVTIWKKSLTLDQISKLYKLQLTKLDSTNYSLFSNVTLTDINYNNFNLFINDTSNNFNNSQISLRQLYNINYLSSTTLGNVKNGFYSMQPYSFDIGSLGTVSKDMSCNANSTPDYLTNRQYLINAKVKKIRYDVLLSSFNNDNLFPNISAPEIVQWGYQNNITVVLLVSGIPTWLQNRTTGWCSSTDWTSCTPLNYTDLKNLTLAFIKNVTNNGLYNSSVEVEIGNEVYGSQWLNNLSTDDMIKATEYVKWYNSTYDGIKSIYPNMRVGGGSTYQINAFNVTRTFLSNLSNKWDFIVLHDYYYTYPPSSFGRTQYSIQNATAWLKLQCSLYATKCNEVYLSEHNMLTDDINVFTNAQSQTLSTTLSFLLNNYAQNYTTSLFKFGTKYKNSTCDVNYNYTAFNQFNNQTYQVYNVTYNYARYSSEGSTIYNSTSDNSEVQSLASKYSSACNIILTNTINDYQNVSVSWDTSLCGSQLIDTQSGQLLTNGSTVVLNNYDVRYLTKPGLNFVEGYGLYKWNYLNESIALGNEVAVLTNDNTQTSETWHITSTFNDTLTTASFNVQSCNGISVSYTPKGGVAQVPSYTCANGVLTLSNIPISISNNSNVLQVTYSGFTNVQFCNNVISGPANFFTNVPTIMIVLALMVVIGVVLMLVFAVGNKDTFEIPGMSFVTNLSNAKEVIMIIGLIAVLVFVYFVIFGNLCY
jgi:hypothetical protein